MPDGIRPLEAVPRRNWTVIVGMAVAAAGVLALQAFLHGHYSAVDEYDDGVYFGASVELWHGVLAYRDFAFIQPPMITIWMLPFAALSSLTGTAVALEAGRFFVDLVTVANVVFVGVLVRRRPTMQVVVATAVMAFSQGTIRASQTVLLEPFLVVAFLGAFLLLMEGEGVTTSSRRLWWAGILFGVAGATKVWALLPLVAALVILSRAGIRAQGKVVAGACGGFLACSLPFLLAAPSSFLRQVVITQATRSAAGFSFLPRLADLTGIPGLSPSFAGHEVLVTILTVVVVAIALGSVLICWADRGRPPSTPLERLALWGAILAAGGLLVSPTYYYHYSAFMAPFSALVTSSVVGRLREPLIRAVSRRSLFLPTLVAWLTMPAAVVALAVGAALMVAHQPVAPQVGDAVSDAIPGHGCVLYANPTLALLDDRFTSDVKGCPDVIDWLGQERVLDAGLATVPSDARNRHLQIVMGRWIDSSDAVVLGGSDLGLDGANVDYLKRHFDRETGIPRGLRVFVRRHARV
jgi:hypothetical protein